LELSLFLTFCVNWFSSHRYDGADDCILNLDSKHLFDHQVFINKQSNMLGLQSFPHSKFVDQIIQDYSSSINSCGLSTLTHSYLAQRLSSFRYWAWMEAYRNYELLQCLPYESMCSCSCDGICGDGTSQAIRQKQLSICPLPCEVIQRSSISFQDHTFLKVKRYRELSTRCESSSRTSDQLAVQDLWYFCLKFELTCFLDTVQIGSSRTHPSRIWRAYQASSSERG
jgi:hypothetical protein